MKTVTAFSLEETKRHGSVWFPFNIYPCTIPGDFPSVALHWHKAMEIIFVKKGEGTVQMDLQSHDACGGDLFILPPGTLHAIRQKAGKSMDYENIIFDLDLIGLGAADLCAHRYLSPLAAGRLLQPMRTGAGDENYRQICTVVEQTERLCEFRPNGYELAVKAMLLQLLFELMKDGGQTRFEENASTVRLKFVLQQIRENFAEPITVEEVASRCGISTSHFMRWFRQMTGNSFVSYLNEYRLSEAAQLLRATDRKILAVANECGFDSLSNFNRQFKARYGTTPRKYRKGEALC